ncbi:PREDICTED: ABC transporter C family member 8-like [Camelina sativa]|uniref:ABC-type xenobiotic transporter n=1 Tax=Camelina sativa TaxID=90675 RepID=A0ABM1Q775_CAMSA|nr:PREDICTED: ABC transporter C family member 8-like [Camelina sativa]
MGFLYNAGSFPWCDVELNLASSCFQRTVIDFLNLFFLSIFYLLLMAGCVSKHFIVRRRKKGWVFVVAAICCVIASIVFLGVGLNSLVHGASDVNDISWAACFVEGIIWVSLAVSMLVNGSKWTRILVSVWWVSFALLDLALKSGTLLQGNGLRIFDVITSPMSVLLLLCSWMNLRSSSTAAQDCCETGLSDPLLTENLSKEPARLATAGFFSMLSFSWMNPLLSLGFKRPLSREDIPSVVPEDEAELAYSKFSQAWDTLLADESSTKERNLVFRAVVKVYFKENIFITVCAFFRTVAVVSLPLMLYVFVDYANSDHRDLRSGFFNLACLVMLKLVESLSMRHWYFASRRSGMRIRSALMVAAYKKQLKLSSLGRKRHSSGEIVNYIAVDAYRMGEFLWWFHSGWSLTLQLLLSTAVLFGVVGAGAFPGLILLLLCGLLNLPFAKMLQNCQTQFMMAQDKRLRSTSEILNSMKVIKLQSWEEEFKKKIESCRDDEFIWLTKAQLTKAFGTFLYWMSPTIVSSVIFVGCALLKSAPLNASTIFTVLATLRVMSEPVKIIPEAISAIIQVNVSFDRLNNFLLDDELKIDEVERSGLEKSGTTVDIQAGNFSWDPETKIPTLRNIHLDIKHGQRVAVCGPVGAGKSSLLHAVLGEIPKVSGTVKVSGSIAYVSQTSWIQSGTIRDNILYGKPMEPGRYNAAIKACALDKDMNGFGHGDLTEIGQRGINLSGGQKQRIQLSRAVYADADVYLLDDPFSAVDAHTAGILFHVTFFSGFTNAVFKAPMLFFDSTPVGRILTRASSDLNVLDFDIPFAFIFVVAPVVELVAALIIMTYVTWQVIIIALLALAATKVVQDYYLASARELIRINGTTKAPVMNYAAEASLGVVTIRAFGTVERFFKNYLHLVDADAVLFFLSNAAMEWVILRIETLQNVTLFTCALLLILIPKGYIAPGLVGLSLSYALTLTQTQVFLTRWYCTLSNSIISVERIKQYMNIPEEAPAIVEDRRPPSSWPSSGTIHLQELKIRYRPNAPLVLKGISCTFREGTRVGVVGRTGSGKSTLISALFRLVEPASGCILIDGIDISKIGLKDLRMKLSIIPQEPTLFRGCIRTNLDPLGVYSDDEIWKALEKCQLKTTISNLPNKLDSSVSDEGENWSVGQRQLFCLGRVLLKRNKILVLDEATASIDSATDAIIQRIIREEFADCTVITVAHRVPTVIDSDMVMVLSYGELVEYNEPSRLMETDSYFSKLVAEYWASCRGNSSQNLQS